MALPCSECKRVIGGNMFEASDRATQIICEDCYWEHHYRDPSYTKTYKHSIAPELVARVGKHSRCSSSRRQKENYRPYELWTTKEVHMLANAKYSSDTEAQKKHSLLTRHVPLAKVIQDDYSSRPGRYAALQTGDMRLVGDEWLYKDLVQENPWKNIRVAVGVGPLVFENGTEQ